jgi:hypothetical protein
MPIPISEFSLSTYQSSVQQTSSSSIVEAVSIPSQTWPAVILLGCVMGIVWWRKRHRHQQRLNQQRALLERLWEMSPSK